MVNLTFLWSLYSLALQRLSHGEIYESVFIALSLNKSRFGVIFGTTFRDDNSEWSVVCVIFLVYPKLAAAANHG